MESRLTPYEPSTLIACSSALVFAPHPDDEVLGCGGLLAAYQAAGIPAHVVLVTSGDVFRASRVTIAPTGLPGICEALELNIG